MGEIKVNTNGMIMQLPYSEEKILRKAMRSNQQLRSNIVSWKKNDALVLLVMIGIVEWKGE
jgi:hypothetical protein